VWNALFLEHPHSVGETYFEHQRRAFWFAGELMTAGIACTLHALAPRLFVCTASAKIMRLHEEMTRRTGQLHG
jgi:hypothetical protein